MGLSTMAKAKNNKVKVDFDIRGPKALKGGPLYTAYGELVKTMCDLDLLVFSFASYFNTDALRPGTKVIVVCPDASQKTEWLNRIAQRDGKDSDFYKELRMHYEEYVAGWSQYAKAISNRCEVIAMPISADQYLADVLDSVPELANLISSLTLDISNKEGNT